MSAASRVRAAPIQARRVNGLILHTPRLRKRNGCPAVAAVTWRAPTWTSPLPAAGSLRGIHYLHHLRIRITRWGRAFHNNVRILVLPRAAYI